MCLDRRRLIFNQVIPDLGIVDNARWCYTHACWIRFLRQNSRFPWLFLLSLYRAKLSRIFIRPCVLPIFFFPVLHSTLQPNVRFLRGWLIRSFYVGTGAIPWGESFSAPRKPVSNVFVQVCACGSKVFLSFSVPLNRFEGWRFNASGFFEKRRAPTPAKDSTKCTPRDRFPRSISQIFFRLHRCTPIFLRVLCNIF